jgi:hypothetical protein
MVMREVTNIEQNRSHLVGIGTGNPGVEKGYPYPNPEIPIPRMPGMGISGLGWQVPLVPGILSRVVRKPGILCQIHHSTCKRGSSMSCCYIMHSDQPLHCTWQSATALHMAICHCIMHGNLLLHCTQQSAVASCMAISCCIMHGN